MDAGRDAPGIVAVPSSALRPARMKNWSESDHEEFARRMRDLDAQLNASLRDALVDVDRVAPELERAYRTHAPIVWQGVEYVLVISRADEAELEAIRADAVLHAAEHATASFDAVGPLLGRVVRVLGRVCVDREPPHAPAGEAVCSAMPLDVLIPVFAVAYLRRPGAA